MNMLITQWNFNPSPRRRRRRACGCRGALKQQCCDANTRHRHQHTHHASTIPSPSAPIRTDHEAPLLRLGRRRRRHVPQRLRRQHVRRGGQLRHRWQRRPVELVQLQHIPQRRILVYVPLHVQFRVVVGLHEIGNSSARVLDLLVPISKRHHCYRTVG